MVDVDDMWDDEEDNESVRAMTFPKCKKPPVDVREYVKGLGMTDDALIEAMARNLPSHPDDFDKMPAGSR